MPPIRLAAALLAASALAACASHRPPPLAETSPRSELGTVVRVRPIGAVISPDAAEAIPGQVTAVAVIRSMIGPGETQLGLSYSVRRDLDGVTVEIAQPTAAPLQPGARVRIVYDARVRLVPT
jgi:hypothetical protein